MLGGAGSTTVIPVAGSVRGAVVPVAGSVVVGVPVPPLPGEQLHSRHWTSHAWPIGQSESAVQPVWGTVGTQRP